MKVDITRQNLGTTLLLFIALFVVVWHRWAVAPIPAFSGSAVSMPLGGLIDRAVAALPATVSNLILLLLVFVGGLRLTQLISRNMILLERTYMPAIIYLIVGCGSWYAPGAADAFVASLLMIVSFDRTINSFRREVVYTHIFNAALLHGIAILVYAPTAVYLLMLPATLTLLRKRWREWIVAFTGVVLPTVLCSYVYWGMGRPFTEVPRLLAEALYGTWAAPGFLVHWLNPPLLLFWGLLAGLTLWSLAIFLRQARSMRTRPYKSYFYFIWILLFTALLLALPGRSVKDLLLLAIPLAVIIPTCFNRRESALLNAAYLLLLGSVLAYNLIPFTL